jgi:hypothetical protein
MSAIDAARAKTTEAQQWVGAALAALNRIIGFNGKRDDIDKLPEFQALKPHFHVTLGPPPPIWRLLLSLLPFVDEGDATLTILKEIRTRYFDISVVLSKKESFLGVDSTLDDGNQPTGAWTPLNRDGPIRITPLYLTLGPLNQVFVLIHESAHFLGSAFQDYAYRDRTGEEDQLKYINLPLQYAIRNADSYAYYALQMGKGIDRIFKAPYAD